MSRRAEFGSPRRAGAGGCGVLLLALMLCAGGPVASAQEAEPELVPAAAALEEYLAQRQLRELLAAHLEQQLRTADGDERVRLADRLGKVYVELLDAAQSPDARRGWEERSNDLLRMVPESDSFDLRINLAKVNYLHAEEIVERHRLRLARPAEVAEAERILRDSSQVFQGIGSTVHRRVEALERREQSGREEDTQALRERLAEARRLRSLAMYYAGWSNCYLSYLLNDPRAAGEALTHWGWLLNTGDGRQASVERLSPGLLRYEHVARAALGSAVAESQRGNDDTALRWLDAIDVAEELPDAVRQQVFARRMVVLASAKRWADLEMIVRRKREPRPGEPAAPLPVGEARLLAVLMLEALQGENASRFAHDAVQSMAGTALGDLVALGEVKHVVDLVGRYGTTPLAGQGFIVQYVRGLETYESARAAHTSSGDDPEEPTTRDAIANSYRQAAGSLRAAVESDDAGRFPEERTNAGLLLGLSFYYAGDMVQAANEFEAAAQSAARPAQAEEALWLAVVALDKATERGQRSVEPRLQRLAATYLSSYPRTERAARLLLRQSTAGLVDPDEAAEVLLAVERESPLYEAARRHAAGLLYQLYRRASGPDRDFAATRFVTVAEEVLGFDRRLVGDSSDAQSVQAAEQVALRVRQILDAVLGMSAPDLARARKAIETLDAVRNYAGVELTGDAEAELNYRRLQIAMAMSDAGQVDAMLGRLHAAGGRFADAADRLLYREALKAWLANREDATAAAMVVRHGARVMQQFGTSEDALADASVYSLHNTVADAAAAAWRSSGDADMRGVAIRIDRGLLEAKRQSLPVLRRYAELVEAAGDAAAALDAWRTLLSGARESSPEWYEARYQSLRLLAGIDPARAREAMDQHKLLRPDLGPEPWGELIGQLDRQLPSAPPDQRRGGDQPEEGS